MEELYGIIFGGSGSEMKLEKSELAHWISKLKNVVPKKASNPALRGILVNDGYLIASNLEMTVKVKVEGAEGERFIIPERAFDLINNLPEGDMEISATKNAITIKADKIKNKYQSVEPDQFPLPPEWQEGGELSIKSEVLLEAIRRVSYAIPALGTTPTVSSMCLQAANGKLNFVGLDGHVLAWDNVDYDGEFELLIPKNTVDKLKTIGLSGEIQIKHNKTGAVFISDQFEVYTRLVAGTYFKYQTLFKKLPLHTFVSRADLLNAMIRAKMCTEERCPVRFELDKNILNLSMKDKSTDYYEKIDLQEEMQKELVIGFDAKLVLETLKAFDCENVKLSFDGSKIPMIVEDDDSNFKAIVLPVAIK